MHSARPRAIRCSHGMSDSMMKIAIASTGYVGLFGGDA